MSWYRSRHAGPSVTPALPTQQKTVTATTSQQVVTPDSGYVLDEVTVNPQEHTASFTPTANLVGASGNANDMGLNHNKRYVNTSGMITPGGTKSITSNGTHDVSSYANASVSVPTSSIQSSKSATVTPGANWSGSTTQSAEVTPDSGYDAMSKAQVSVPMIRDDNILQYSTTSTPSTVYRGDTSVSNSKELMRVAPYKTGMIYTNSYLYVDPTEGGWTKGGSATSITPSNSSPVSMSSGVAYKPTSSGYAISSYSSVTPSSSGTSFSSGMVKMSSSGYAYSSRPSTTHTQFYDALNKNDYEEQFDIERQRSFRHIDLGANHNYRYVEVYW